MTSADLASCLQEAGYPVDERKLTDWRQKALLPPLRNQSRGRSRGVVRTWAEPDILDRALAVCALIQSTGRADETLYRLFLAGFEVNPEALRNAWCSRLDRRAKRVRTRSQGKRDGIEAVADSETRAAAGDVARVDSTTDDFQTLMRYAFLAWADPRYRPDIADLSVLIVRILDLPETEETYSGLDGPVEFLAPVFARILSNAQTRHYVQDATDAELGTINHMMVELRGAAQWWAQIQPNRSIVLCPSEFALQVSKLYGPVLAASALHASKAGLLAPLADTVTDLCRWVRALAKDDVLPDGVAFSLSERARLSFTPYRQTIARRWQDQLISN